MRETLAVDHIAGVLQRLDDKNLRMDFCAQNRFNCGFRTAAPFL
jgi:hypothetical protein